MLENGALRRKIRQNIAKIYHGKNMLEIINTFLIISNIEKYN